MSLDKLFSPFRINGLELPNRVVMAPMTRGFSPGGVPTDDVAAYYQRRAEHGVGLIITEGTGVDRPASLNDANYPRFHGETELAAWKKVVDAVHTAGGLIAPQLWHVGYARGTAELGRVDSPSGLNGTDKAVAEPMSDADIADTIAAFGKAAGDAKRLGFDAVELHAAHGYLIDQFFWDVTNRRDDGYGGAEVAERARFGAEVVKAVRAAIGPDLPLIIRVSQFKGQDYGARPANSPAAIAAWLTPLAEAGVDVFHCSQRRFWEPEFEGSDLNFAGWVKKLIGKPTISVGSVGLSGEFLASFAGEGSSAQSIDQLLERLDREEFDLIAVGRAILNDPEWVEKVRTGDTKAIRDFDAKSLAKLY